LRYFNATRQNSEVSEDGRQIMWRQAAKAATSCEKSPLLSVQYHALAASILAGISFELGQYEDAAARYERLTSRAAARPVGKIRDLFS